MAHLDVVPVDEARLAAPAVRRRRSSTAQIWGRGTLDDKGALVARLRGRRDACSSEGITPAQDVWLSFGCDEEVFGTAAPMAVEELARRGVRPWFVVDEGGAIAARRVPRRRQRRSGSIGVTEKGVTSLELRVEGRGGHASTPARIGPTARLARAITRLDTRPMPASVPAPTVELFRRLAPHAPARRCGR